MSKRGRPSKPTNIKLVEGTYRKDRARNEPVPKAIPPTCPTWLNSDAKKMWKHLAPELERLELLTIIDGYAFAAACQSFGVWVEQERFFKKKDPDTGKPFGRTYTYTNKVKATNIIERPEVKIGQKSLSEFRAFCSEFGLSPSARVGLDVDAGGIKSVDDDFEDYLTAGR